MDNGSPISIIYESAEFQSRDEFKDLSRVNLAYLEVEYYIDTDLSVVIFYKSNNEMQWQQTNPITLDKNARRRFVKLQNGLTCMNFYIKLYGNINDIFEMTMLRVLVKPVYLGKLN